MGIIEYRLVLTNFSILLWGIIENFWAANGRHRAYSKIAAKATEEPIWQLPLEPWHKNMCPSAFADTANSRTMKGGGAGGASNAAGFLARFVENDGSGWLHFDLAAAYNGSSNSFWAAGGTGLGIATIAELIK